MASRATPGPWVVDTDGDGKPHAVITSTHDADGLDDDVCEVYGGNADDDGVREANARLIAAAPDLADACVATRALILAAFTKQVRDLVPEWLDMVQIIEAALAKAGVES